jgi:hypothetical protein
MVGIGTNVPGKVREQLNYAEGTFRCIRGNVMGRWRGGRGLLLWRLRLGLDWETMRAKAVGLLSGIRGGICRGLEFVNYTRLYDSLINPRAV